MVVKLCKKRLKTTWMVGIWDGGVVSRWLKCAKKMWVFFWGVESFKDGGLGWWGGWWYNPGP